MELKIQQHGCHIFKVAHFSEEVTVMLIELSFVSQHVSLLSFLVFLFHLSAKPTVQSDLQLFRFLQTKIKFSKKAKTSPMKM